MQLDLLYDLFTEGEKRKVAEMQRALVFVWRCSSSRAGQGSYPTSLGTFGLSVDGHSTRQGISSRYLYFGGHPIGFPKKEKKEGRLRYRPG